MENLPQPWRHGYMSCMEKQPQKGVLPRKLLLIWAKGHDTGWVHFTPYHAPASGKIEWYNGLLKATLGAMGGGTFKHWDTHLGKATCSVNTRGSASWAGHTQSNLLHTKVPCRAHKKYAGEDRLGYSCQAKANPPMGLLLLRDPDAHRGWWGRMGKSDTFFQGIGFWVGIANDLTCMMLILYSNI